MSGTPTSFQEYRSLCPVLPEGMLTVQYHLA
jgi:hypothetical protein